MGNPHDAAGDASRRATFAEGQADPVRCPADTRIGRFSDGQTLPAAVLAVARFTAGTDALGDEQLAA